jgi:hypothetical protein
MIENIKQVINRIINEKSILLGKSEEVVKHSVILPILSSLGWSVYDIKEVEPEYKVSDGRVDYCLKVQNKKVFIEAKKISEDLDNHERQLLEYSFKEGVEIAVLTNGLLWWLYLPTEKGHWQERKFFTIDFNQQDPGAIASHFEEFLSKSGVVNGTCIENAKKIKQGKEREAAVSKAIRDVWNNILTGPDETLLEMFAERVESFCGYRPEPELIANFFKDKLAIEKEPTKPTYAKPLEKDNKPDVEDRSAYSGNIKVDIGGRIFTASSVSKFYYDVLKYLCDTNRITKMNIPFETSAKRYLIAKEPYHQRGNEFRIPVEYNGYYIEAHKDHRNALNHLGDFLGRNGISYKIISYGS